MSSVAPANTQLHKSGINLQFETSVESRLLIHGRGKQKQHFYFSPTMSESCNILKKYHETDPLHFCLTYPKWCQCTV